MIARKFPEKEALCHSILSKDELSILDVITLDKILFSSQIKDNNDDFDFNQNHKSFDQPAILEILMYQKKNKLNNAELSRHYNVSRNTIVKWKKLFQHELTQSKKSGIEISPVLISRKIQFEKF